MSDSSNNSDFEEEFPVGFHVIRSLGAGGMGTVWLARQNSLGRNVAVKQIRNDAPADAGSEHDGSASNTSSFADDDSVPTAHRDERFQQEAELLASVNHPGIVTVHDRVVEDGRQFLVMEYVDGRNLRHFMQEDSLSLSRAAEILHDVSAAVSHLHELGILHRDLKPENVLIDHDGRVKVTDFGIATRIESAGSLTQTGAFVGTVDYMSPEQRHGLPMTPASDQYSLAVIAYELLTGQKPLGVFEPPSVVRPEIPAQVDGVIMRGLQKHAEYRFESLSEFDTAFQAAMAGCDSDIGKTGNVSSVGRVALASCLMLGLMAVLLPWNRWLPRDEAEERTAASREDQRLLVVEQKSVQRSEPEVLVPPYSVEDFLAAQQQWASYLGMPAEYTDSIGTKLILIPPAEFMMGTDPELIEDFAAKVSSKQQRMLLSETPAHRVRITRPYYLSAHEVTLEQFGRFTGNTGYQTHAEKRGGYLSNSTEVDPEINYRNPRFSQTMDHPVVYLNSADIQAFCEWMSDMESESYRLPSEAEWELACRAGTTTLWFFGDESDQLSQYARFVMNSGDTTSPVGSRLPNPIGLYDMYGNVLELCRDGYSFDWYHRSPVEEPVAPVSIAQLVTRGGSFRWFPEQCRSAARNRRPISDGYLDVGFRLVVEIRHSAGKNDVAEKTSPEWHARQATGESVSLYEID